jgi:putative hydrolase of the HAD superfamily
MRAVIFDWGGTLTPWHTVDAAASWTASVADDADVARRLLQAEVDLWTRSRDEHLSFTMDDVYDRAGHRLSDDGLAAYHRFWDEHTFTDPAVPGVLRGLHERGLRVGVLSNTSWPRSRHEQIFARDGVLDLIDAAVYSSEIPYAKPHPEAFRAALAALGVADPAEAVYVGDRLFDDIFGAQRVGMRAVFVPHSDIPEWQVGSELGEPDAVVGALAEVVDVIDVWRLSADAGEGDGRRGRRQ